MYMYVCVRVRVCVCVCGLDRWMNGMLNAKGLKREESIFYKLEGCKEGFR